MKLDRSQLKLYAITHRSWLSGRTLLADVESALKGGATMVQLREKTLDFDQFLAEAIALTALCHRYGVPLIINDNVEIARLSGADGVHVGQNDLNTQDVRTLLGTEKIIGVTAKTVAQAILAQDSGADYLGSGAVFGTTTKLDANPLHLDDFQAICHAVSIPVVAIGGITAQNLDQLKGRGMAGVALVSTIFAAQNIQDECAKLSKQLDEIVENQEETL